MKVDELWPGTQFLAGGGAFPLGTDAVLLADFARGSGRLRRIADLGCGGGVITVLLLQTYTQATAFAIDILPEAAEQTRRNLALNGLDGRAAVCCGDLRERANLPEAGSFDLVVSNPPYFPVGSGYAAPDAKRAEARDERSCTLSELCAAAAYLTRWGGSFALVHRPERLSELCCALAAAGLEPKRLRPVCRMAGDAPSLILLEARRGGKPGLRYLAPLCLYDAPGQESAENKRIYHLE